MATWGGYDQTILATRFQKTFIKDYLDLSGRLDVQNSDVSLNRLFVMNDASFAGNVYVGGNVIANIFVANNDVSLNNRLFVLNETSFMGNLYVDDIVAANFDFVSNGDASLNSNVFVGRDISCNGNVSTVRNLIINGNLAVQNYTSQNIINTTTTNYQLVVSEDLSLNGRLAVSNDVSMNGNLFVSKDISLNGNIRLNCNPTFLNDSTVNGITLGINNSIYNTIVGYQALSMNTAGSYNTAIGAQTLMNNTGSHNTAIGDSALEANTIGSYNTAFGASPLSSNTTGTGNTAFGGQAGAGTTGGTANITGSYNIWIGSQTVSSASNYNNSTVITSYQLPSIPDNNKIIIGRENTDITVIPRIERHLAPPIIMRKALSTETQTINTSTDTIIKFPTLVYDNGYTGVDYNNTTGYFTNNSNNTVNLLVSASVNIPGNSTGGRAIWIETISNTTYVGASAYRFAMVFDRGVTTTLSQHVSSIVPLDSGASVYIKFWQTTGSTMTINNVSATSYPTSITIRSF